MLPISKVGRGDGAGEYYLAGVMAEAERFTGKVGQFYGPKAMLEKLGLTLGQATDEATFRCLLRGMDPAKGKAAFHHQGGAFNPQGLLSAAWADADAKQRKAMMKDLRQAGVNLGRTSFTSSAEKVLSAWEKSSANASKEDARQHDKAVFKAAGHVAGYTLVQGAGPDRQTGYDLTLTLPKDISVLYAMATKEQRAAIEQIVRDAGNKIVDYLNMYAGTTRAGKGGEESIKGTYMASSFVDFVARPVDMRGNELPDEQRFMALQDALGSGVKGVFVDYFLHNHIVVNNLMGCEDGKYRAVDGPRIYQAQAAAGMVGMAYVAQELRTRLGIETEKEQDTNHWTIPGIARSAVEEASKRSQIIALAKDEKGLSDVPQKEIGKELWDLIKLETREDHVTLTNEQLDAHVKPRMEAAGHTQAISNALFAEGGKRTAAGIHNPTPKKEQVLESVQALLANEAVFSDHKLRAHVLGRFCGSCDTTCTLKVIDDVIEKELISLGEFDKRQTFTTAEMLALEANCLDIAKLGKHKSRVTEAGIARSIEAIGRAKAADGKPMSQEQIDAARHLLAGDSMVSVLVGPAGAGKTYTLETVQHCLKSAGYTITGCALSWSASQQMKAEGKLDNAAAVTKLCYDIEHGTIHLNDRTAVVLDEGSLLSSRETGTLLTAIHKGGSKLIITGDTEQIQSAGAGAAMRAIVERCGAFELGTVRRQSQEWDRLAGLGIRAGGEQLKAGIEAHIAHGRLRIESSDDEAVKALFQDWHAHRTAHPDSSQLMISRKNAECDELNRMARDSLHAAGQLGKDHTITVAIGKDKKDLQFATGDLIQFRLKSKSRDIRDGDEIIEGQVFNRTRATIQEIAADSNGVSSITVELWSGDQKTGETMTLKADDFRGSHFAMEHAYAVTPDSSQSMTVDHCLVLPGGMDQQRAYVSLSRHRHDMKMYVSRDETHKLAARYMDHDVFVDRNDWTNAMAQEALIASLRRSVKMNAMDFVSDTSRFADMTCLKGSRYEHLVRTNQALVNTWQLLDAAKTSAAANVAAMKAVTQSTDVVTRRIQESGLTGKLLRPSIIHAPDNSQQLVIKNHRDQEQVKRGLLDAVKAWGSRIYLSGRKSFHAACVKLSRELGIKFGSSETHQFLKESVDEHHRRRERVGRISRAIAGQFGAQFGAGVGLSGPLAVQADGARIIRDREQRVPALPTRDLVLQAGGQGAANTDGVLPDLPQEQLRGRQPGRDRDSEPVQHSDSRDRGLEGGHGKGPAGSVAITLVQHDVQAPETKRGQEVRGPAPVRKPTVKGGKGPGM